MGLDTYERTEQFGGFTVAGVGYRGDDVDKRGLWTELEGYAAEFEGVAVGAERYGVSYDIDERDDGGTFTYVAGAPVESTAELPAELTGVVVPESTYAVFPTDAGAAEGVTADIARGEFGNVDHDHEVGVLVERYASNADPSDPDTPLELYVPLLEE